MRSPRLRVGVSEYLLTLAPAGGGHGRVWRSVLDRLGDTTRLVPLDQGAARGRRRLGRQPQVVLADGHTDLPAVRAPLVVQVHEAGWFEPQLRELLDPSFYAHVAAHTERAVRAAAHVITPSDSARHELVDAYGLDPERVHAVPHGVEPTFAPGARGGRAFVAGRRGGRDAPYILFAAMLHPRKNLAVLRDAVAGLVGEGFPHVLAIVGGPATDRADSSDLERAACAELPGAPDRVVRLGRPDDAGLAGLMAEADAFCLPSLYEGFGLTALEAMACGAPVVVSDRGALPEVVGDTGLVVPPTVDAVRGALRRLLGDRRMAETLGRTAAKRARGFTWERTAQGWLSVLHAAVASDPRSPDATYTRGV